MTTQRTKRLRKPSGRAMLSRSGLLTCWDGFVSVYAEQRRGERARNSLLTLTLHGEFTQPVRGVSAFDLRLSPEDQSGLGNVEIPCVGVWIATMPTFDGG